MTVGCSGRVVRLLRGRGNDNELTYGQRCSGRACINIHLEAARGRGPPRPAPSFLRSFLPVNIDLHYEHFYWQRHQQNRTACWAAPAAPECNVRTHARKHGAAEQQNKRKEGIKEGIKEGGRGLDSFTHSPQRRETFAAMPPGRTDEEEEASLVGAARRFLCTRCTQAASSRITMAGSAAAGVSLERSCKYDGLFV